MTPIIKQNALLFSLIILFAGCTAFEDATTRLQAQVVGHWTDKNSPECWQFLEDGTFSVTGTQTDGVNAGRWAIEINEEHVKADDEIIIETDAGGILLDIAIIGGTTLRINETNLTQVEQCPPDETD